MSQAVDAITPEDFMGKAYDAQLVRRLGGYLRPYRGLVAWRSWACCCWL